VQKQRVAVGFYRDHGKTKPITKHVASLSRKKLVSNAKPLKEIAPTGSLSEIKTFMQRNLEDYCKRHKLRVLAIEFNVPREMRSTQEVAVGMAVYEDYPTIYVESRRVRKRSASEREASLQHEVNHVRDFLKTGKKLNFDNWDRFMNKQDMVERLRDEISAWKQIDHQLLKKCRKHILESLETYNPIKPDDVLVKVIHAFKPKTAFPHEKGAIIEWIGKGDYYLLKDKNRLEGLWKGDNDFEFYPKDKKLLKRVIMPKIESVF
jgi:hypothetical protein